jgi:hypothetical protein
MLEILNNKGQMASPPIITGAISQPIIQPINLISWQLARSSWQWFPAATRNPSFVTPLHLVTLKTNVGSQDTVTAKKRLSYLVNQKVYETSRGKQPVNQSSNHPIIQSINQPINQSTNQ